MKRNLQIVLAAAFALIAAVAQAEEAKSTFKVDGMTCGSCESTVKNAVTKVEGVKSVEADASNGQAIVSYDPAKVSPDKITAAINATKYKVVEGKK